MTTDNKTGNWGGKREGAGRKQTVLDNSKPRSIYCSQGEFIKIKRFLAFERSLQTDTAEISDTTDSGAWNDNLRYVSFRKFISDTMAPKDWHNLEQCLQPDTVQQLRIALEKSRKKITLNRI